MRILFVTEEPIDFSGAMVRGGQIHVKKVVEGLRERGHDVHLIDWNDSPERPYQHSVSPRTRFVDGPIRTFRKVLSVGRSLDPDVIISKTRKVYLPGLIAARWLGVHHVVHVGSGISATNGGVMERLDAASKSVRLRAPHGAYFVVCEAFKTELVENGVAPEQIYNVRNAVDHERFRPNPDIELAGKYRDAIQSIDRPLLGFVGSVTRKKGVLDLAEAVSTAAVDPTVLVAGQGPAHSDLVEELGPRGVFLGAVPYQQMPAVYAALDALVLPSRSEGLPRVVLEACASGIPVVATRVGGIPEVIEHHHNGLLYDRHNPNALSDTIDALFEQYNPNKLGSAGRTVIVDRFGWEQQFDRYERYLGQLT